MIRTLLAAWLFCSLAGVGHAMSARNGSGAKDASPMSAVAASSVLSSVCEAAASAGKSPAQQAGALGLKSVGASPELAWALATDARVWSVRTRDSDVLLYAYGPNGAKCGVIVGRPIPGAVAEIVLRDLGAIGGYAKVDASTMPGDVAFTRVFSETSGHYVDVLEYPARARAPGVLKLELLVN